MSPGDTININDEPTLVLSEQGPPVRTAADISDIIAEAFGAGAAVLVIPKTRLGDEFFDLKSGLAGELAQKCVNYHVKLVVLGEIDDEISRSDAFRDYVREANRGGAVRFVSSVDE